MNSTPPAEDDVKAYIEGMACMWAATQSFRLLQRVVPARSLCPCLWMSTFRGQQEHHTFSSLPQT